ncbi:MAG: hypothetical protein HY763_03255 [Planctomycetes bacterium]|nr:hypothetical protein [Planctomycetota bacterium]
MLRNLVATFGWLIAATAFAQDPGKPVEPKKDAPTEEKPAAAPASKDDPAHQEAVEVLKKVNEATKAVKAARYKVSFQGTGSLAPRMPKCEGAVVVSGKGEQAKFRIQAKLEGPASAETREFTVGNDGEQYYLIDPAKKLVYADLDPGVVGGDGSFAVQQMNMIEYAHPTPFDHEVNSEKAQIKGTVKVGDEECYEIHVHYRANLDAVWYFSKKDFLPRRVDRLRAGTGDEKGATEQIITELVVDPKLSDADFKLVVPEGFEKTDDFAPARRPAQR